MTRWKQPSEPYFLSSLFVFNFIASTVLRILRIFFCCLTFTNSLVSELVSTHVLFIFFLLNSVLGKTSDINSSAARIFILFFRSFSFSVRKKKASYILVDVLKYVHSRLNNFLQLFLFFVLSLKIIKSRNWWKRYFSWERSANTVFVHLLSRIVPQHNEHYR